MKYLPIRNVLRLEINSYIDTVNTHVSTQSTRTAAGLSAVLSTAPTLRKVAAGNYINKKMIMINAFMWFSEKEKPEV